MKRTFTLLLALVLILSLGTFTAFAASSTHHLSARCSNYRSDCDAFRTCIRNHHDHVISPCTIDAGSDGICDITPCPTDTDNDDMCGNRSTHHRSAGSNHHSRGHHGRHR